MKTMRSSRKICMVSMLVIAFVLGTMSIAPVASAQHDPLGTGPPADWPDGYPPDDWPDAVPPEDWPDYIDRIEAYISSLPDYVFANNGVKKALLNKLDAVKNMMEAGNYQGALNKLNHDIIPFVEQGITHTWAQYNVLAGLYKVSGWIEASL